MTDLTKTIAPKSDQLNADDLIGGRSLTITVTGVKLCGEPDQPIAINFDGDNGKPYKPCKSMRRVLVNVWGGDGNRFVGRRMTLYRDDKVTFGALAVGGIRISHVSDIDRDVTMALTASKANRKPYTVKPLKVQVDSQFDIAAWADDIMSRLSSFETVDAMRAVWDPHKVELKERLPERFSVVNSAVSARAQSIAAAMVDE